MGGKSCLRCKGKIMLGIVNKLFIFKSLLTAPSNVLPLHLKQNFPPIIWIFNEGEGDEIESKLPFKIFSTLKPNQSWILTWDMSTTENWHRKRYCQNAAMCTSSLDFSSTVWFPGQSKFKKFWHIVKESKRHNRNNKRCSTIVAPGNEYVEEGYWWILIKILILKKRWVGSLKSCLFFNINKVEIVNGGG